MLQHGEQQLKACACFDHACIMTCHGINELWLMSGVCTVRLMSGVCTVQLMTGEGQLLVHVCAASSAACWGSRLLASMPDVRMPALHVRARCRVLKAALLLLLLLLHQPL